MCGHVGRPGTGLHPLRGQNNVQGASDAGLIPMVFPDYNSVKDPAYRGLLEDLWVDRRGARYFFVVARASKTGTPEYNRTLSHKRANSVMFHISDKFEEPDLDRFPALSLARAALEAGGAKPGILSAANEVAVASFLESGIAFLDIAAVVSDVLAGFDPAPPGSIDGVLEVDREARARAAEAVERYLS